MEIVVKENAEVKYSTVQNWYPGDKNGKGGVLNLVTKRGHLRGANSRLSWTQVETGSAITWKYPSCVLSGDNSQAEFYSVAVTNNFQQADTAQLDPSPHAGRSQNHTTHSRHSRNVAAYSGYSRCSLLDCVTLTWPFDQEGSLLCSQM